MKVIASRLCGSEADPAENSADVFCYCYQTSTDRVKFIAAQQVEGQGAQQREHLNTILLSIVVVALSELGVARPVPLAFNGPALPNLTRQGFWAGA